MKKLVKTGLILLTFASCGAIASGTVLNKKPETTETFAADKKISNENFIICENFLYSGKGFILEFTFTVPSAQTNIQFNLMNDNGSWHRLTDNFTMTFKADGSVQTNKGKVFKINDRYFLLMMFSDLANSLNKNQGEVANGTETVNSFYIPSNSVDFLPINAELISSELNTYFVPEFRDDDIGGLRFKAHMPTVNETANYGMIIVPSNYIKGSTTNLKEILSQQNLEYLDIPCVPKKINSSDPLYTQYGDGYAIQASIVNIKEENYELPFVAIPYFESSGQVTYGNFIKNSRASYFDAALAFKNSSKYTSARQEVKDRADDVIYKCEHHVTRTSLGERVKAYFAYNTDKVFKNAPLPETLKTEDVLYSAKNEVERGQIIVNVPNKFNQKYYASFEPFVNVNDKNSVIGVENISISQELYTNVKTNWSEGHNQPTGWYPDGIVNFNLPLGYVADALLPFNVAFDSNQNVFTSENGNNNALLYTIKVPENAKSGTYKSKIVIKVSGEGTLALPVTLNVFDFKLPEENKNKYVIKVHNIETAALYGDDTKESIYHNTAYNMLKERGISGGEVPASYWQIGDTSKFISKTKELARDPKVATYWLPMSTEELSLTAKVKKNIYTVENITLTDLVVFRAEDKLYNGTTTLPGMKTMFRELIKASTNELDLLKKASIYCPQTDEPGKNKDKQIQNILCENCLKRIVDELLLENIFTGKEQVKESLKKIPYIVTSYPRDYLKGADITELTPVSGYENKCRMCYCENASAVKYRKLTCYCPTYESYQYDIGKVGDMGYSYLMEKMNDPDFTLWWYSCIQPVSPYPCFFTNANLIQKRVNKWTEYALGVEGELYYMCNRTQEYHGGVSTPCTEEQILQGLATYEQTYGDGNLIYPVHKMYGKYDSNLFWLTSLRIENVAESIDDYNYIAYADELIKNLNVAQEQKQIYKSSLMSLLSSVQNGPGRNTTNQDLLFNKRVELANLIVELCSIK